MSEKKDPPPEEELGAPMYMLSFGDMMTNLLCFFILLCAFAEEQRVGFISDGLGSFRQALMSHGLPGVLQGDRLPMDLGANRVLFRPAKSVSPKQLVDRDGNIGDANRDALRDVVLEALQKPGTSRLPVPLVFARGSAKLSAAHEKALQVLAPMLARGNYLIHVEGYAWDEGLDRRETWELAMKRAESALRYLASVGDIDSGRLVPYGYGPPASTKKGESPEQERHGRRIVLLSLVRPGKPR